MKKIITVLCLAVAPVLFAQEKAAQATLKQDTQSEQKVKEQKKADQIEAQKRAEADKKAAAETKQSKEAKKSEIKATENRRAANKGETAKSLK